MGMRQEKHPASNIIELRCMVCAAPIPEKKARYRSNTCSDSCRLALRRHRLAILNSGKCPHCYHPSTPAEWEEFREWRKSKGAMQQFMRPDHGNKLKGEVNALREGLQEALDELRIARVAIHGNGGGEAMEPDPDAENIDAIIGRLEALTNRTDKNVVDTVPAV